MKQQDLPPYLDGLRHTVTSPTSCSSATVDELATVLGLSTLRQNKTIANASTGKKKNETKAVQTALAVGSSSKGRKRAPAVVLEVAEDRTELKPAQELRLATEIVNASLKVLTEAVKEYSAQSQRAAKQNLERRKVPSRTSSSQFCQDSPVSSPKPLQHRSINRITNIPNGKAYSRRSSSTSFDGPTNNMIALAECSRLAFAALRKHDDRAAKGEKMPTLQLEMGMSALIGKLVALGMEELAVKELRILIRRVCPAEEAVVVSTASKGNKGPSKSAIIEPRALPDLLSICKIPGDSGRLNLLITSQMHVMKLLAMKRRASYIEAALVYLDVSQPCSLFRCIENSVQELQSESRAKAFRQVEQLAQTVSSFCPSASNKDDALVAQSKKYPSAEAVVRLKLLQLEMSLGSQTWDSSKSKLSKDIVGQCVAHLRSFVRRSSDTSLAKYKFVEISARKILELCSTGGPSVTASLETSLPDLHHILSDLARDCGNFDIAVEWAKRAIPSKDNAGSPLSNSVGLCHLACLRVQAWRKDPSQQDPTASIQSTIDSLKGSHSGSSAHIEDLLISLASLRKLCMALLSDNARQTKSGASKPSLDCKSMIMDLLGLIANLLIRYASSVSSQDESQETSSERRWSLIIKSAIPLFDAVAAMARPPLMASLDSWKQVEQILRDCTRLARLTECRPHPHSCPEAVAQFHQNSFVVLSNAYWCLFLARKQYQVDASSLKAALQTSISILKDRSPAERETGFLHTKLEKLGAFYESQDNFVCALDSFSGALQTIIEFGYLQQILASSSCLPPARVIDQHANTNSVSRLLISYTRNSARIAKIESKDIPYFDEPSQSVALRGLLLELQLPMLLHSTQGRSAAPSAVIAFNHATEMLMRLYPAKEFPIRRLRVSVQILRNRLLNETLQSCRLTSPIIEMSQPETLGRDTGLEGFKGHLLAQYDAYSSILTAIPNLPLLQSSLEFWNRLFQQQSTWVDITNNVDNPSEWISQLDSIAEFLHMKGYEKERSGVLSLLSQIHALNSSFCSASYTARTSALGLQLIRLGYSGKAGICFQQVQAHIDAVGIPLAVLLKWSLSYSEYLLQIGNLSKCEEFAQKAYELYKVVSIPMPASSSTTVDRYEQLTLASELMHLHSLIAVAHGRFGQAIYYARKSAKLTYRAWMVVERQYSGIARPAGDGPGSDSESLSKSVVGMSVSEANPLVLSNRYGVLQSSPFWTLVPRLFSRLLHLSSLLSHEGILPEAEYYAEQALKVSEAIRADRLKVQIGILQAEFKIRSGKLAAGVSQLSQLAINYHDLATSTQRSLQLCLAKSHALSSDRERESTALQIAENLIAEDLSTAFLPQILSEASSLDKLSNSLDKMSLASTAPRKPKGRPPVRGKSDSAPSKKAVSVPSDLVSNHTEFLPILRAKAHVWMQRSGLALRTDDMESAESLLMEAQGMPCSATDASLQSLIKSQLLLRRGLQSLSVDPIFSLLLESTFSIPSASMPGRCQNKDVTSQLPEVVLPRSRSTKGAAAAKAKRTKQLSQAQATSDFLTQSFQLLVQSCKIAQSSFSSADLHMMTDVLCKTLMMLSATSSSTAKSNFSSTMTAYAMELARSMAFLREGLSVHAERLLGAEQYGTDSGILLASSDLALPSIDIDSFQTDYIDIIPEAWTVVSLSISHNHDELYLSKLRSGQNPFVLTIPLNRSSSRDCDEESFGFDEGKGELMDIIGLANYSCHNAGDMSRKGAKAEWWEARAALDARFKDLLVNIENIWLGGFRGLLSEHVSCHDLLSRFQQSFYNILDKHLPSRQRGAKTQRVALDARVLELFVGLGNPAEVPDLDEPLMDLLYFVVDILQFHGERNAYDEIDFDPITIEVLDALTHYHEAAREVREKQEEPHTILILDKALHLFPWESLPCLDGHAVSRLPSLSCLRDRILSQQKQNHHYPASKGLCADASDGAYVLNPGGDLAATQDTFKQPLGSLTSWSATIKNAPTEAEIKAHLSSRSIYLYFGHGSGGQYIRSRTIKKLESCAVALLMGCSSSALTEAGEFESYGTPIDYLHAGAPAVVGTLWDVTDKDIDRFSMAVMKKWGLLESDSDSKSRSKGKSPVKRSTKEKGRPKSKVRDVIEEVEKVSLDKAVAQSRDSCILRYLNGAAPVVYGVPVFLA